jgi:hypothetical protein
MKLAIPSLAIAALAMLAACDDPPNKLGALIDAGAASSAQPATTPTPPEAPKPPSIAIAPGEYVVNAEHILVSDPDVVGRLVANLTGKPLVEGAIVPFDAPRAVKPSQVVAMLQALQKAKAKGALARTENRDKVVVPLALSFSTAGAPPCTPVALITKESRISVWTMGGQVAHTFTKGFAGPDMTLGTEQVRTNASHCDSPYLVVAGDEAMIWGLVYDLATMSMVAPAGATSKTTQVVVAPATIVPGRKVTLD